MDKSETLILLCYHCGNETLHNLLMSHTANTIFEQIDEKKYLEPFDFYIYACSTCNGITVFGDFLINDHKSILDYPRLYPTGSNILPPDLLLLLDRNPVPDKILKIYEEIWPLRRKAPNAFAVQIRRAMEFICKDRNADGNTLFEMVQGLISQGILPGRFTDMADLIRKIGNISAHAFDEETDIWDAELMDSLFRAIVEYVYIAPAKIDKLKQRIKLI